MGSLVYAIVTILVALWLVGFVFAHVGGPLIHVLLVVALVLVIFNLISGRRVV